MKTRFAPISQKKALGYALRPYKHWDEWIKSPARPFSKRELALIDIYRETNSYAVCAGRLHISMVEAANEIIEIIMRLKFQLPQYKKWEQEQKSLYTLLIGLGVQSLNELKDITFNDLKHHVESSPNVRATKEMSFRPP